MSWEIDQPESIEGGGKFIDKPGVYHMLVTEIDENPSAKNGTPLAGKRFTLTCLASTEPNQKDKTFDLMLWDPQPTDKSDLSKKRQTRFALAVGLLGQYQPGQRASVNPQDAHGRQLVIKLGWRQKFDEATGQYVDTDHVDVHFADIWHVDDPEVAKNSWPVDAASLKIIPRPLRKLPTPAGGNNAVTTAPAAAVTSTRSSVDLSKV